MHLAEPGNPRATVPATTGAQSPEVPAPPLRLEREGRAGAGLLFLRCTGGGVPRAERGKGSRSDPQSGPTVLCCPRREAHHDARAATPDAGAHHRVAAGDRAPSGVPAGRWPCR